MTSAGSGPNPEEKPGGALPGRPEAFGGHAALLLRICLGQIEHLA
jgi:hypothetical protein